MKHSNFHNGLILIFLLILFLCSITMSCSKKGSEPQADPQTTAGITEAEETRLTSFLEHTIDMSTIGSGLYNSFSTEFPASVFAQIKTLITNRTSFLDTCYTLNTTYNVNAYTLTPIMKKQLNGIAGLLEKPGVIAHTYFGIFLYYVNREATLVFNLDGTLTYNSTSPIAEFVPATFTGLPKIDTTVPATQSAAGTYTLTETDNTVTGGKDNVINWDGNTDADKSLLGTLQFQVLIVANKNILITFPFTRDTATITAPTSIQYNTTTYKTDLALSRAQLLGKWNYLDLGSFTFNADFSWNYKQGTQEIYNGTWEVYDAGGKRYLRLTYSNALVFNEATGTSEMKSFTASGGTPRFMVSEYYVDDSYFGMNIYRSTGNELVGTWTHNNYDYMDNFWSFSYYPVSLTVSEYNALKALLNQQNIADNAFLETCFEPGDPRVKKTVKGPGKKTNQPQKQKILPLFELKH